MSIRDLLDAGIRIQGAYRIETWNDDDDCEIFAEGSMFEDEVGDINDDILEKEIKYMYPTLIPTYYSTAYCSMMVFEVE